VFQHTDGLFQNFNNRAESRNDLQARSIFKDIQMTFTQGSSTDAAQAQTVPQHHLKAAEHLELASRSHKEAAKLHASGDHKAAEQQAQMAREHTAKAGVHVSEAGKKSAAVGSSYK
jgi:hypothetical protein